MHGILSDFIYLLNSNILFFSDSVAILQKSLSLHTFSWDLSLFFVLKEWRKLKQQKLPLF